MSQLDTHSALAQDLQIPNMEAPKQIHRVRGGIRRALTLPRVLFAVTVVSLCMMLLYHQMHLTRLTKEISEKTAALEELQSEYVSLKTRQEQALSIGYVEEYAQNQLGMVKIDPSQIKYIEITNPEMTEVSNAGTTLGDAVAGLMRSFTAVLEYLR